MPQPNADKLLQGLLDQAQSYKSSWIHGPLSVVSAAHKTAIQKYEKTLADQKAVDDMQAEIAITILIVGGGALLSLAPPAAVLLGTTGTSALSRLGARITRNFPTAVNVAHTFSNRTVVKYIWKGLSKESTSFLKKQVSDAGKKQLSDGLESANVTGAGAEHLYSAIEGQIDRFFVHIEESVRAVMAGTGTETQKLAFAKETRMSPFMRPVPSLEAHRYVIERRFELMMYMGLILEADSLIKREFVHIPIQASPMIRETYVPIKERPLDPGYPTNGNISYKDTGNTVARRINTLVAEEQKDRNVSGGSKFMDDTTIFSSTVNARVMRAADTEARRLMALNDLAALIPMAQKF
jgi:hypothetical protein